MCNLCTNLQYMKKTQYIAPWVCLTIKNHIDLLEKNPCKNKTVGLYNQFVINWNI